MTDIDTTSPDMELQHKAISIIQTHIADVDFNVSQLADLMGMSRSTLYRRVSTIHGCDVSQLIRDMRLTAATEILDKTNGLRIAELAYRVGFSDARYFSKCFKEKYGISPSDWTAKSE